MGSYSLLPLPYTNIDMDGRASKRLKREHKGQQGKKRRREGQVGGDHRSHCQPRLHGVDKVVVTAAAPAPVPVSGGGGKGLSELQEKMRRKLEGAQFRMLNEELYTCPSGSSFAKFSSQPELFDIYHRGFNEQVAKWPVHPLDYIIDWLKRKHPHAVVSDFGCGEARLAASVPNQCHSFDLVAVNPSVTACDMANVPLADSTVDVAVFCLSLMGTNLMDFIREARRVLRPTGRLMIAEVRSRFDGMEKGVNGFVQVMKQAGFDPHRCDASNKMFLMMEFRKADRVPDPAVSFSAKACLYKRR